MGFGHMVIQWLLLFVAVVRVVLSWSLCRLLRPRHSFSPEPPIPEIFAVEDYADLLAREERSKLTDLIWRHFFLISGLTHDTDQSPLLRRLASGRLAMLCHLWLAGWPCIIVSLTILRKSDVVLQLNPVTAFAATSHIFAL